MRQSGKALPSKPPPKESSSVKLKNRRQVFRGSVFSVERSRLALRKRAERRFDVVRHGGSSVILPILKGRRVILIRQARPAVGQTIWEIPAGTVDKGEAPLQCARRELVEETGYRPGRLKKLLTIYPSPGFCDELMHIYVATGLTYVGQRLELDEDLRTQVVPFKRVLGMIQKGLIRDAKTICAIFLWRLKG